MLIAVFITEIVILLKYVTYVMIIAPAGISPRGEIPRRHPSNSRVYYGQYLQFKYTVSILEKISICSNWGREESVGNDDVSIVLLFYFVTFIGQSYFDTLLRYAVTFCGPVVLKVMDQKTLVKRRGGYKVRSTVYIFNNYSLKSR